MGGGQGPTPDPEAVEAELREQEIAMILRDLLEAHDITTIKTIELFIATDRLTAKSSNLALLKRIEEELRLFTAEHDQSMRDEALAIINSLRKEYE